MLRTILFASLIAVGAAGGNAVHAQAQPRLVGGGDNATVEYGGAPAGAVVGGGTVRIIGGGENRSYTYDAVNAIPGRVGTLVGSDENAQVVYQPEAPTATSLARGVPGRGNRG